MSVSQIRTWTDNAVESFDYFFTDYRDFAFPPHLQDAYAIGVIERAQSFRSGRHTPVLMTAGTLCVINPGMVHEGRAACRPGANILSCSLTDYFEDNAQVSSPEY